MVQEGVSSLPESLLVYSGLLLSPYDGLGSPFFIPFHPHLAFEPSRFESSYGMHTTGTNVFYADLPWSVTISPVILLATAA